MNVRSLLDSLDLEELAYETSALVAWQIGAAKNEDDVAQFLYRGGPWPPQASTRRESPPDRRPEEKYWHYVKKEMRTFLCTDDKRYRDLWKQIDALQKKSTTALVAVIAAFLGSSIGAPATLIAGFVAVCLYAAIKLGKEAYCSYSGQGA